MVRQAIFSAFISSFLVGGCGFGSLRLPADGSGGNGELGWRRMISASLFNRLIQSGHNHQDGGGSFPEARMWRCRLDPRSVSWKKQRMRLVPDAWSVLSSRHLLAPNRRQFHLASTPQLKGEISFRLGLWS